MKNSIALMNCHLKLHCCHASFTCSLLVSPLLLTRPQVFFSLSVALFSPLLTEIFLRIFVTEASRAKCQLETQILLSTTSFFPFPFYHLFIFGHSLGYLVLVFASAEHIRCRIGDLNLKAQRFGDVAPFFFLLS